MVCEMLHTLLCAVCGICSTLHSNLLLHVVMNMCRVILYVRLVCDCVLYNVAFVLYVLCMILSICALNMYHIVCVMLGMYACCLLSVLYIIWGLYLL